MNILIIYFSKHRAATKFAQMLASRLKNADLCNLRVESEPDLTKYKQVVLGSSIYMGRFNKRIRKLAKSRIKQLLEKDLYLFAVGGLGDKYLDAVKQSLPAKLVDKVDLIVYGGYAYYLEKMNWLEKLVTRMTGVKESVESLRKEQVEVLAKAVLQKME
ncbi:MAG: flavodoxin domain-containing protein [Myxococcota bacterium]